MPKQGTLASYDAVLRRLEGSRKHLLLGNGFSIACDAIFAYDNLYEHAVGAGLPDRVQAVFEHLGTNNFEGVMRLLDEGAWLARQYGIGAESQSVRAMVADLNAVKAGLVEAIAETHLERPGDVEDVRKDRCVAFLEPYHNVFTTNYDLLLYWVAMHGHAKLQEQDGFRAPVEDPDAAYLVFSEHLRGNRGILFLHGALHLYMEEGEIRKHSWTRTGTPLIPLVREALENGRYPLFVAEGAASGKLDQIQRNAYLSYCLSKLSRIEAPLVTFGLSFGDSDQHIVDACVENPSLDHVYIGIFGSTGGKVQKRVAAVARRMRQRRREIMQTNRRFKKELRVTLFNSRSVPVWDAIT